MKEIKQILMQEDCTYV